MSPNKRTQYSELMDKNPIAVIEEAEKIDRTINEAKARIKNSKWVIMLQEWIIKDANQIIDSLTWKSDIDVSRHQVWPEDELVKLLNKLELQYRHSSLENERLKKIIIKKETILIDWIEIKRTNEKLLFSWIMIPNKVEIRNFEWEWSVLINDKDWNTLFSRKAQEKYIATLWWKMRVPTTSEWRRIIQTMPWVNYKDKIENIFAILNLPKAWFMLDWNEDRFLWGWMWDVFWSSPEYTPEEGNDSYCAAIWLWKYLEINVVSYEYLMLSLRLVVNTPKVS